ncbi:hypothetical protein [Enhygromyxa salina]|uniref:PLD phosphodiesterase domain-containing protein n=1 Tax=Enhygromyxa salina TaxID=215803 RepID=A0A2S9XPV8_9BACT|nr:hypothetical protein [Enhygromyxa salina]PRP94897.1 hypothetical protein ENSA7_77200 [Enhygromyxa salina]
MKVAVGKVLDRLAAEEMCFGALFLTYAFDPSFFENHVLRAVLRLSSDPVEQPTRYHDEALASLQVTPIAVIADAGVRQGGRRLAYDLLDVSARVFHSKLAILLYEGFARVHVGSGNLTSAGYGSNAELFLTLDLRYDIQSEAQTLHELVGCIERASAFARRRGTQLHLFMEEFERRLPGRTGDVDSSVACLDSTLDSCILDQALALLPADAVIERVGIMAPFFERDDRAAAESLDSVFGRLYQLAGPSAHLDVGVLWENPAVRPQSHTTRIADGLGRLWGWLGKDEAGNEAVTYLVPTKVARTRLHGLDAHAERQSWPLKGIEAALAKQTLWPLEQPRAYAPPAALESARAAFESMQVWLHPTTQLVDGRLVYRPLHAKLLVLAYETAGRSETLVVVGSANASRKALLLTTAQTGNVELCFAQKVEGSLALDDIAPDLVACPHLAVSVHEREFPDLGPNYALAVLDAVYDAAARTLVVEWTQAVVLPAWSLTYRDAIVASGVGAPTQATVINEFDLHRSSAELTLIVGDFACAIPILVSDLVALPVGPGEGLLGLYELLLLLGRRLGRERLEHLTQQRLVAGSDSDAPLDELFGLGFGPTDVFKAWWSVAAELAHPETSVAAFRLGIDGSLGLRAVWKRMLEAAATEAFSRDTIWFYGAELLRELSTVHLPDDDASDKKRGYLDGFVEQLQSDLDTLVSDSPPRAWLAQVRSFYGVQS